MKLKSEPMSDELAKRVEYALKHWVEPSPKSDKPHVETEPIFGIHIEFCDGSKPMEWFNLNLKQAAKVLQEWSEEWILIPEKDCKLNGTMWNWHANVRHSSKQKDKDNTETYSEILDPYYLNSEETEPCE